MQEKLNNVEALAVDELATVLEVRLDGDLGKAMKAVQGRVGEKTWQAFYQVVVEKRPAGEVAEQLGMSRAAVYQTAYRVRQMIGEEYDRLEGEGES
jgi:DNA-directed RNA polymerase specialized sigma24 family protein